MLEDMEPDVTLMTDIDLPQIRAFTAEIHFCSSFGGVAIITRSDMTATEISIHTEVK